jgi:hypothetical protein
MNSFFSVIVDKPPSYFNVVGQIRAAKSESNNPFEFFSRSLGILCGSSNSNVKILMS